MGVCSSSAATAEEPQMSPQPQLLHIKAKAPASQASFVASSPPSPVVGAASTRRAASSDAQTDSSMTPKRLNTHGSSSPLPPPSPDVRGVKPTSSTSSDEFALQSHQRGQSTLSPMPPRLNHQFSAMTTASSAKSSPSHSAVGSLRRSTAMSSEDDGNVTNSVPLTDASYFPLKSPTSRSAVGVHRPPFAQKQASLPHHDSHSVISTTDVTGVIGTGSLSSRRAAVNANHQPLKLSLSNVSAHSASPPQHHHNNGSGQTSARNSLNSTGTFSARGSTTLPCPIARNGSYVATSPLTASLRNSPRRDGSLHMNGLSSVRTNSSSPYPLTIPNFHGESHSPHPRGGSAASSIPPSPQFHSQAVSCDSPHTNQEIMFHATSDHSNVSSPRAESFVPIPLPSLIQESEGSAESSQSADDNSNFTPMPFDNVQATISTNTQVSTSSSAPPRPLPHSITLPADLSNYYQRPANTSQEPNSARSSPGPSPPHTFCTTSITTGLTDDGFYHVNQYIVEMGPKKRAALERREQRMLRREAKFEAKLRQREEEAEANALNGETNAEVEHASDEEFDDSDLDTDADDEDDEDEDEEGTILGRGSYGVVKKVFNSQDGQFYAMKIMSKSLLGKSRAFGRQRNELDGLDGVRREIAIMKKLSHRNIVKLVEVICDEDDDNLYLVMEYAERGCVMHVDIEEGEVELPDGNFNILTEPLEVETARHYFRDILTGLEYLHHQKVIHRDIKPENLLLTSRPYDTDGEEELAVPRLLIADFGVSTLCEGDECLIASTAGTSLFMSPEMIKSGAKTKGFGGPPTDVWATGVTLYFFLYGRLPWYAKSLPEIYRLIAEEPLKFPEGPEFSHIPFAAQKLITGMLDKNPKTRYTIEQMLRCPWVSAEGAWDANAICGQYKHEPLVAHTLCPKDIASAMGEAQVGKEVPPTAVKRLSTTDANLLTRLRSRFSAWKSELHRKCEEKKALRRAKRATVDANGTSKCVLANLLKQFKGSRRRTLDTIESNYRASEPQASAP